MENIVTTKNCSTANKKTNRKVHLQEYVPAATLDLLHSVGLEWMAKESETDREREWWRVSPIGAKKPEDDYDDNATYTNTVVEL